MTGRPMYRQIYDDLIRGISDGTYPSGSRLPSEKELADMYSVSRITSKKALEMLADRGIILRKPGKGSFVLNSPKQNAGLSGSAAMDAEDQESGEDTQETEQNDHRKLIGVILDFFDPSFGCELVQGIEYECRRRNADMLLHITYGSVEEETKAILEVRRRGADAIILMCAQDETYNEDILKLCVEKYPLVLIDRALKGLPVPTITTDNYTAACELTEYLIEKGHRKIGFLSHSLLQTSTVKERFYGYRDTMGKHLLQTDESQWFTGIDQFLPSEEEERVKEQEVVERMKAYIRENPDISAYVAVSFRPCMLMWKLLRQMEIKDREVVCFDWIGMEDIFPAWITHVEQDQFQMGVSAVREAVHRIRAQESAGKILVPYRLVRREP